MEPKTTEKKRSLLILYGSQTGVAESITQTLKQQSLDKGYQSICISLNEYEKTGLKAKDWNGKAVIIVTSTTGDGDPPDNAINFWKFIRSRSLPKDYLVSMNFALLGLGDTNFENFCNMGKRLYARLIELGAQVIYKPGWADDATGLEEVVEPWMEGLWPALEHFFEKNNLIQELDESRQKLNELIISEKAIESPMTQFDQITNTQTDNINTSQKIIEMMKTRDDTNFIQARYDLNYAMQIPPCSFSMDALTMIPPLPKASMHIVGVEQEDRLDFVQATDESTYSVHNPFMGRLNAVRCLTSVKAVKRTLEIEVDLVGSGFDSFLPGDSFGIYVENNCKLVEGILARLNLNPEKRIRIELSTQRECPYPLKRVKTLFDLFHVAIDLCAIPKKSLLRSLAEYATNEWDKLNALYLCSKQGMSDFQKIREQRPTLLEILNAFPSSHIPLDQLLECIHFLQPRFYSAINSPLKEPGHVKFAFSIVESSLPQPWTHIQRYGVGTSWIDAITGHVMDPTQGIRNLRDQSLFIPIYKRLSTDFIVPKDTSLPLIMVAPGTGIAPFIGFLQHRTALKQSNVSLPLGETWLFFGCRHPDLDYLYKDELKYYVEQGSLHHLQVSFSRFSESTGPRYVQEALELHGKRIIQLLLHENAYFYLCGDVNTLVRSINDTLIHLLTLHAPLDMESSRALVHTWIETKRIIRDIWS